MRGFRQACASLRLCAAPGATSARPLTLDVALQEGGEDEVEEAEPEAVPLPEAGMRKSARTENVDFKQREEER